MNVDAFLAGLKAKGVALWIDENDELAHRESANAVTRTEKIRLEEWEGKITERLREGDYISGTYPLSPGQEALWAIYNMAPETPAYNTFPFSYRIRSGVDYAALGETFQALVNRHACLRTLFSSGKDGRAEQHVHGFIDVRPEQIDASEWDEEQLKKEAKKVRDHPFDLRKEPPARMFLFRRSEKDHLLMLAAHHIVVDGDSYLTIKEEFQAIYKAKARKDKIRLPVLRYSYEDFLVSQRQTMNSSKGEADLKYWNDELADESAPLDLPFDYPRPPVQTFEGAACDFELAKPLGEKLKELAAAEKTTLFRTFLAAFNVLLHRYAARDDIAVGIPASVRPMPEWSGVVGYFINMLPIRADLSGDPSFKDLLERIHRTTLNAVRHKAYPFPSILEKLRIHRESGFSPVFQSSFTLHDKGLDSFFDKKAGINLNGVETETFPIGEEDGQFDLSAEVIGAKESIFGTFKYNTALFKKETMERMVGHFEILLHGVADYPDKKISELPILTEQEQHRLMVEFNDATTCYPKDKCIHHLFEEQAEKTPDAPAVVFENRQSTYRELNERANRLGRYLQKLGVGPEVLVGICMERSIEMIVGIIGILKAGGAYVPLDPDYPEDRISYMLDDAGAPVLLTQKTLAHSLPELKAAVVCLDSDWDSIARESKKDAVSHAAPDNLAYVIYTSGSTGRPKGVMIPHSNVVRLFSATEPWFQFNETDGWTLFHSCAFDFSVWELWGALIHGGRLIVIPYDVSRSPGDFYALLVKQGVTVLNQTPSAFYQLIRAEELAGVSDDLKLRLVIFGGEALNFQNLKPWFDRHGDKTPALINMYGITETTVHVTYYPITSADVEQSGSIVGRPIPDLASCILNDALQPSPPGVAGELYIGGEGLARGYLNRPELTEERFIENPFSDKPGARLYRTGDLARYLPDGAITYLGRIDNQVQIRGFRVELGEIESVLSKCERVREVVVIAGEDRTGNKQLAAYLTPEKEEHPPEPGELREFLRAALPGWMIPAAFVVLPVLPLTPNGKIDRKALPAPDMDRIRTHEYVPPANETEKVIAKIWKNVLSLEKVGRCDHFFELGGHSLSATIVVSRVDERFDITLPIKGLFDFPTLSEFGAYIDRMRSASDSRPHRPIRRVSRAEPPALSFAQQRLWFLDRFQGENSATYNVPMPFRATGAIDLPAVARALNEIIRRHEVLRTVFRSRGEGPDDKGGRASGPVQVILPEWTLEPPVTDISQLPENVREKKARRIASEAGSEPFDLSKDPLMRASIVRMGAEDHLLVIVAHHSVFDGWSAGVFFLEFKQLYKAFSRGEASPLPDFRIQYADFAHWQRERLDGDALRPHLDYWKKRLAGAPAFLELPADRPRPPVQTFNGDVVRFELDARLTRRLNDACREFGVTLFMMLYAAFAALLSRFGGKEDIVIGSPIANRNHKQIEHLIGFFVNTLALRADLGDDPEFSTLLDRVKTTTLDAYDHQDLPFEKLVDELHIERSTSRGPLFQVMFVLQEAPFKRFDVEGVTFSPFDIEFNVARFDLTLSMEERDDALGGMLEYNTDLFDRASIERMKGSFETILADGVTNPGKKVSELSVLTGAERHRLLVEFNETESDYPRDKCIHHLFEERAEKRPDAPALVFENRQLTYRELNERANRLGRYLQDLGVGPEVLVGICMERSIEMIVGLLGILKAGGAYAPIDPAYPEDRISYMLEDAKPPVLLTQKSLTGSLPELDATIVCLDSDRDSMDDADKKNVVSGAAPDNLAYVMYTSGSTGTPKGVEILHRGVVRLVKEADYASFSPEDVFLFMAPLAFDASTFEIWGALLNGGKLVVMRPDRPSMDDMEKAIKKYNITTLWLTSGLFHQIVDERLEALTPLRQLLAGGDVLSVSHVKKVVETLQGCRLINGYGPTENTTFTCCFTFTDDREFNKSAPIGSPISNTQVYILDACLQPVPIGVPGELHIGGAGLARGYLNRPDLTNEKFIPNTFGDHPGSRLYFGDHPGSRLYKTGDLCRWLPDGNIEFMGRLDHQVKIRGFRIELGEIEFILGEHGRIREAVVIAREDRPGGKRLVAYVAPKQGDNGFEPGDARAFLKTRLPDHMIPSAVVVLDALPLTPNGKVDRRALPAPDFDCMRTRAFISPRNEVEETLGAVWTNVLGVEKIGVFDDFFEIGGHSLLATQVVTRIQKVFGIELDLKTFFQKSTIDAAGEMISAYLAAREMSNRSENVTDRDQGEI